MDIIKFYKVSYEQFKESMQKAFSLNDDNQIKEIYDAIKLPARATKGSAGYDFFLPFAFNLEPNKTILIPTGIKAKMPDNVVLMIFPRSSLGFKYRLTLNNTVGIIDSDYINALNEGHIFIKMTNDSNENKTISLNAQDAFAQGIFLPFLLTIDDNASQERIGGIGSTNVKEDLKENKEFLKEKNVK